MKFFEKLIGLTFVFLCIAGSQADARYMKANADTGRKDPPRRFSMCLTGDSTKIGDIFIEFRKNGQMNYDIDEDSLYSLAIEDLKLCSISDDRYALTTNVIPFPSLTPEIIKLYICPKDSGTYKLNFGSLKTIPRHIKIMLIDKYLNCSVEVKENICYSFNTDKKDLLSYGDKRFMLVIYENQNYYFQPEVFGIIGRKKKTTSVSIPMQVYSTITRQ